MDITEDDIAGAVRRALGARQISIYGPRGGVRGAIKTTDRARIVEDVLRDIRQRATPTATVTTLPTAQTSDAGGEMAA